MNKILLIVMVILGITQNGNAQINSLPGSYNWSSTSAWSGGVVPTASDVVNIVNNSSITVDFPLVHNANINVNGGVLNSMVPTNSLILNNANLTLLNFGSIVNFASGIGSVPITINNGHLINDGVYMSGNLSISFLTTGTSSVNNGDFIVQGNMTLTGTELFDNNLVINVAQQLLINSGCILNNNQDANIGDIVNYGSFANLGSVNVNDSIENTLNGIITSAANDIFVTNNVNNDGSITISDSMVMGGNLINTGTYTNNGGAVNVETNFYNSGTITGSLSGNYLIYANSENTSSGIINGDIDVCDTSLAAGTYLDLDNGMANVDFNTVTFCTMNLAGLDAVAINEIIVYPNPTRSELIISGIDLAEVSLLANDGRVILKQSLTNANNTLEVSNLPCGTYFVRISMNDTIVMKKISKI